MSPVEAMQLVDVVKATEDDAKCAIRNALTSAGCTLDELKEQARAGRFVSDRARRAWFVISALGEAA